MMNADVGIIETGVYKISHSPYELKFLPKYSGFQEKRNGTLLRIQDSQGDFGYADLHQWPSNFESAQSRLSFRAAEMDLFFRKKKRSAWDEILNVGIENNYLLVNFADENDDAVAGLKSELSAAVALGFRVVKVKVGKKILLERSRLQTLIKEFTSLLWRLDFNSCLSYQQVQLFLTHLSPAEISRIEYIEDPCPYSSPEWSELNKIVPVAFDQPTTNGGALPFFEKESLSSFQHIILKPALQNTDHFVDWAIENNKKITVTCFMDHALGQAQAFYHALQIQKKLGDKAKEVLNICGLRTQFLFAGNEFSAEIENANPQLLFPNGTGFGFDQQLRNLQWQHLS